MHKQAKGSLQVDPSSIVCASLLHQPVGGAMAASHRRLGERAGADAMNGTQKGSVAIAVASVLLLFCFLTLILVTNIYRARYQRQPPIKRPTPATTAGCTGGSGGSSS